MKLKKIASLALAGIMAVSMLAGCKSNPADPETPNEPVVPTTSSIGEYVNNLMTKDQKKILTFDENANLASAVSKIAEDSGVITPLVISGAKTTVDGNNYTNWSAYNKTATEKVKDEFKSGIVYAGSTDGINNLGDWYNKGVSNQEKSDSVVFVYVLSGDLSDVGVANAIYDKVSVNIVDTVLKSQINNNYVDYTGSIAATKVSNSVNSSESAWVVGVMFTKTITNGTNTQA